MVDALCCRGQQIGQVEILGALAPYLSIPNLLAGRPVIHWIDNTSALAALVKGYSGVPDSARLIHVFHAWNSGAQARVWFEYVPTKENPARTNHPERICRRRFMNRRLTSPPSRSHSPCRSSSYGRIRRDGWRQGHPSREPSGEASGAGPAHATFPFHPSFPLRYGPHDEVCHQGPLMRMQHACPSTARR